MTGVGTRAQPDGGRRLRRRRARGRCALVLLIAIVGSARAAGADDGSVLPGRTDRPIAPPGPVRVELESALSADARDDRPIAAPDSSLGREAMQTIVALAGVIGLVLLMRQILRRVGDPLAARRPSGVVQVLARFPFGKGQQLVLVQLGSRVLCLHQSASTVATLCELRDADEIASLRSRIDAGTPERQRFDRELTRELSREPRRDPVPPVDARSPHSPHSPLLGLPTETVDLTGGRFGLRSLLSRAAGGRR